MTTLQYSTYMYGCTFSRYFKLRWSCRFNSFGISLLFFDYIIRIINYIYIYIYIRKNVNVSDDIDTERYYNTSPH